MGLLAIVRIRSMIGAKPSAKRTIELLSLSKVNSCVIVPDNVNYRKMMQVAKDFVTWGPVKEETVKNLIKKRGRKLPEDAFEKLVSGIGLRKLGQPCFFLHPPRKGFKGSVKRSTAEGGVLGFSNNIDGLVMRMM